MNLFQELRQRRVPQITSGYVVGGWGLLQFLAFLESRMAISPHLVNLIGLTLVMLLPSVVTLAWVHGRPGRDTWGRTPKVVIPANIVAVVALVLFVFSGQRLGAVTQTIEVQDENGAISERVVPHGDFRKRVLIYYPEFKGAVEDAWVSELTTHLLSVDLSQDIFVDAMVPSSMVDALTEAGAQDGHNLSRPLQRKLARDGHWSYFQASTIAHPAEGWRLDSQLYDSRTGKLVASRSVTNQNLFTLVDLASRQLREDLGIPTAHLDESPDLPIADLTTADLAAARDLSTALVAILHRNDWQGALAPLEDAVSRDPEFALAQYVLSGVRHTLGDAGGASAAIAAAMANIYRLPERLSFSVKAQYYYNEKQDADKALAVTVMWSRIYPNDIAAYEQQANFYFIRQDIPNLIAAYENILAVDPTQLKYLGKLADLYTQLGDNAKAEEYLQRYVTAYPAHADGYADLADFLSRTGRLDEARETLDRAQILDPEDVGLELAVIDLDVAQGQYTASEEKLTGMLTAADNTRDRAAVLDRLVKLARRQGRPGVVLTRLGELHEAMLENQNPLQADIIYSIMLPAVSVTGRPEAALAELAALRQRIPAPYDDLVEVGNAWCLADLGRTAEATAALDSAVAVIETFKFETFRPIVSFIAGLIAEAEGDLPTALAEFQAAHDKAIHSRSAYRAHLAGALRRNGQPDEAEAVLTAALLLQPAYGQLHLEMARLLADRGQSSQARAHLDQALAGWAQAGPEFRPAREARELALQWDTP